MSSEKQGDLLKKLEEICIKRYPSIGSHDWGHVKRVLRLCIRIGSKLGADLQVLEAAALLHDVAQVRGRHSEASAVEAKEILSSLGFPQDKIEKVVNAIREHSYSSRQVPSSLESKILSDADKIDALGALGIYRAIAYSIQHGNGLEGFMRHLDEKLLKLADLMHTEEGRSLAKRRSEFLKEFRERLLEEVSF